MLTIIDMMTHVIVTVLFLFRSELPFYYKIKSLDNTKLTKCY